MKLIKMDCNDREDYFVVKMARNVFAPSWNTYQSKKERFQVVNLFVVAGQLVALVADYYKDRMLQ